MSFMAAPDQKKPGRPKGRTPTYTIHPGIEVALGKSLTWLDRQLPKGAE